jgi:hypothetical protein
LFITANGSLTADVRCGEFTARVALTTAEMTVSDRSFTDHRCPLPAPGLRADDARIEGALRTLLSGTVPWTIDGNVLTIGPAQGAVLHYEAVKSEPAPSPTNTPNPSNTVIPPVTATASLVGSASAGRAIPPSTPKSANPANGIPGPAERPNALARGRADSNDGGHLEFSQGSV